MKTVSKSLYLSLSAFLHILIFSALVIPSGAGGPKNLRTIIEFSARKKNKLAPIEKTKNEIVPKKVAVATLEKTVIQLQSKVDEISSKVPTATNDDTDKLSTASKAASSPLQIVNIDEVTRSVKRTAEAKIRNIEGKIRLKLTIDEHGEIQNITPLNALGHGLDEVALAAARKLIFIPARIDSKNISAEAIYTVNFSLQHQ